MAFWDSIKNAVGGFVDSATEHINNGLNSLKDIGKDVVDAVDGAIDWVTDKVSGALSDTQQCQNRYAGFNPAIHCFFHRLNRFFVCFCIVIFFFTSRTLLKQYMYQEQLRRLRL